LLEFFSEEGEPLQSGFAVNFTEDVEINLVMESGVKGAMEGIL